MCAHWKLWLFWTGASAMLVSGVVMWTWPESAPEPERGEAPECCADFDPFAPAPSASPRSLSDVSTLIRNYESRYLQFSTHVAQNVEVACPANVLRLPCAEPICEPEPASVIPDVGPPPRLVRREVADVWYVSTWAAARFNPDLDQAGRITFSRWTGDGWATEAPGRFFASQAPGQPMLVYIHGNRTPAAEALAHGMKALALCPTAPRPRLVVWGWDSERAVRRARPDFQTKAQYADFQGFYLAWFLSQVREDCGGVSLVAHSFGARTVLCACHLLAGGAYRGRDLTRMATGGEVSAVPISAMLLAAATNNNDLQACGRFPLALDRLSTLCLTQNGTDPALRFYPKMERRRIGLPDAMGYSGPRRSGLSAENVAKIRVVRVEYPSHAVEDYLSMKSVRAWF